jgi:RNA polymerase sigma-70 factor (ECF subfamily)
VASAPISDNFSGLRGPSHFGFRPSKKGAKSMMSPAQLIANAKAGCTRSRGELLESYRKYLKILADAQVQSSMRGRADASDLVQEAFLCAHEAFGCFRGTTEAELSVWLQRILASRLVDLYRFHASQKRDLDLEKDINERLDQSSIALSQILIHPDPSPSEACMQRENARIVADAIEDLAPDYRTVILLRHVRGLPHAAVAAEMNRSVESVKKLWVRALSQLQRYVESRQ